MFSSNSSQVSDEKLYSEDVFSTYLYTGTGSNQTITNGIDLAGKGGLVWIKCRSAAQGNVLVDTANGASKFLSSETTNPLSTASTVTAFSSTGFNTGANTNFVAGNGNTYASWTFREAPKFFDVVTYTGNGVNGRAISHSLGVAPGVVIVKSTSQATGWAVFHRSASGTLLLNTTDAQAGSLWGVSSVNATTFTVTDDGWVNASGQTYVVYLFAHDTTSDGIIQCGSYTGGGATPVSVNLGWEPQFVMAKITTNTGNWMMFDNMRGIATGGTDPWLLANTSGSENTGSGNVIDVNATGFSVSGSGTTNSNGESYIYIAIRRGPMRTPTTGTSVFSPIASSAANNTQMTTGFPIDTQMTAYRPGDTYNFSFTDRLRGMLQTNAVSGQKLLVSSSTNAEAAGVNPAGYEFWNTGFKIGSYYAGQPTIYYNFRRAPSFMDVVCYTGTGSARTVSHNLGVVPELMIVKNRTAARDWTVYTATTTRTSFLALNSDSTPVTNSFVWNNTTPTATVFTIGTSGNVNNSGENYVAYLFASCPGVSKVGTYTGTTPTQFIDCGFSSGARFVLIKRTDSTGNWFVWDTARGMLAPSDPSLNLNNTNAELTGAYDVSTSAGGFYVFIGGNVNTPGATYIYLAIA